MIPALMPTYNRADLAFERGEGARLWTVDGRRFLDFGAGIATSSIGHANPHLTKAIAELSPAELTGPSSPELDAKVSQLAASCR